MPAELVALGASGVVAGLLARFGRRDALPTIPAFMLAGILLGGIVAGPVAGLPARLLAIVAGAGVYALFRAIAILHSFAPRSTGAPNGAY